MSVLYLTPIEPVNSKVSVTVSSSMAAQLHKETDICSQDISDCKWHVFLYIVDGRLTPPSLTLLGDQSAIYM